MGVPGRCISSNTMPRFWLSTEYTPPMACGQSGAGGQHEAAASLSGLAQGDQKTGLVQQQQTLALDSPGRQPAGL